MKLYILEANANLSVCSVRANLSDLAKLRMVERLDELKDLLVA